MLRSIIVEFTVCIFISKDVYSNKLNWQEHFVGVINFGNKTN